MSGSVTYAATQADYVEASRANYLAQLRSGRGLRGVGVIIVISLLLLMAMDRLMTGTFEQELIWLLPLYAGAIALGIAINLLWLPRKVRRMFEQQPAYTEPMTFTWSDQGFNVDSPITSHKLHWAQLVRSRESKASLLFYIIDQACIFVPKRVLGEPEIQELRRLAGLR